MAQLNKAGRAFARQLIVNGAVEMSAPFTFSAEDGSKILGKDDANWLGYGRSHLGAEADESFDTRDHWKHPFTKDGKIYRSALEGIQKATATSDKEIHALAGELLTEIDGVRNRSSLTVENKDDLPLVIKARPPRIEIQPMMSVAPDLESAPVSDEVLAKWNAGLRADNSTQDNVIQVFDVIGYDYWSGGGITADSVAQRLKAIGNNKAEVHINSPGGDMFEGIAIYNVLRNHPYNITVKVFGLAASAASVIAMAGNDILISPSSFFMIHNAWVIAAGNRHDFQEVADYLEPFDFALRDIYVAKSGQDQKQVQKWMDAETYLNGNQAIELKFATDLLPADKIVEDKAAAARAAAFNSVRSMESILTKKGGLTRSQARLRIKQLQNGTPGAAGNATDITRDADVTAMPGAGDLGWLAAAQALTQSMQSK